ncbi:hypothetical protein SUDANB121_05973 (plasmid) [Nocardiopsis dassonvillei]|uniref:hypothetical protein n=1 Tax=Nocardiopsis dassonvillei TaxID=2014 RepID=UPI003F5515DB
MSTDRKERIAAAARSRGAREAAPAAGPQESADPRPKKAPRRKETARRTDPVRMTIDLDPPDYTSMRHVLLDVAAAADHPTLTAAAMWRAMLAEMREDPRLVTRVAARIAADKEGR